MSIKINQKTPPHAEGLYLFKSEFFAPELIQVTYLESHIEFGKVWEGRFCIPSHNGRSVGNLNGLWSKRLEFKNGELSEDSQTNDEYKNDYNNIAYVERHDFSKIEKLYTANNFSNYAIQKLNEKYEIRKTDHHGIIVITEKKVENVQS